MEETIVDWHAEASAVINDVKTHVKTIEISDKLISNYVSLWICVKILYSIYLILKGDGSNVFLNITLLEGSTMTVLLDASGFRQVSKKLNECDDESFEVFETIYSLLQKHSKEYIKSFGNALVHELEKQV